MKMYLNGIASALERLLIESDELLMGFAIIASVGGSIVSLMAVNGQRSSLLLLAWVPVAAFFAIRLIRGRNRVAMLRERWARVGVGAEERATHAREVS